MGEEKIGNFFFSHHKPSCEKGLPAHKKLGMTLLKQGEKKRGSPRFSHRRYKFLIKGTVCELCYCSTSLEYVIMRQSGMK
jgi:hypothetical protein